MAFILGRAFGSFRGAAPRLAASVAAARAPASLAPMLLSLYSPRVQPTALHLRMLSTGPSEIDYHALALNRLKPNPGAHKAHVRVGRGRGGGKGKTSGRGNKGAGARKGKKIPYAGFAGGQTPLHRRIPKRGFSNKRFERVFAELNLDTLARFFVFCVCCCCYNSSSTSPDVQPEGVRAWHGRVSASVVSCAILLPASSLRHDPCWPGGSAITG
ncbi:ribosomal protein L18e/L15P [Pavlovales sp. CCMP2436]|nr:ribosomal protein L18e/L15P [Pavlovales sp. CCMP2436]